MHLFRNPPAGHDLGELIAYTDIFSAFSSPIIILFMGGFACDLRL
ncbi:transporter putative [Vibrio ponticus]|nr:transporter putative [Vibrio ponticus]